jgi:hypothetical protein
MMCLKVRSSIHATSAPTATDDDMEGNDKAGVLAGTGGKWPRAELGSLGASSRIRANRPVWGHL